MISRKVRWSLQACVVMVALAIFSLPSGGHHITRFAYTWMQVGKKLVNGYRVTLIVKPPEASFTSTDLSNREKIEKTHKSLVGFTHHFQVFVEDTRLREPVPRLAVTLSARGEGGDRKDFPMEPRFGERGFHYGGNVRLDRRGAYALVVMLEPKRMALSALSRRREEYFRKREARFEFEYGYQGLKELMGDIYRRFAALARPLMELDLPDPAGREVIQAVARRARRLDRMAELIPALRIGVEQGKFVELSEKLKGDTGKLVDALDRGEVDKAVRALADVWQSCGSCHKLFRGGEFAGR